MWDDKGWKENIPVNILKLSDLVATEYMKVRTGSTFYSGKYSYFYRLYSVVVECPLIVREV